MSLKKIVQAAVRASRKGASIALVCKAMGLPRSTFYFRRSAAPKQRQDGLLAERIRSIQTECQFTIGRRRMSSEPSGRYGISIGENQVQRVMRAYHLLAVTRQKTSAKPHAGKAYQGQLPENLLNREFRADRPLTKLVSDVTIYSLLRTRSVALGISVCGSGSL